MRPAALAAALLALGATAAAGQTIRPLVAEFQREARGRFEIVNDSDRPLNVVLDPRGFSVGEDGRMRDEPMPAAVQLKLSAMSFRLPPRQSRFVFYEATAAAAPAWFVVYANLTGYPARDFSGLNVQLELPHIVYVLPRAQWSRADLAVVESSFDAGTRTLSLVVENRGAQFGRVARLKVRGGAHEITVPGFPLFPGGRRRLDVPWKDAAPPEAIAVDARSFSFEHVLASRLDER